MAGQPLSTLFAAFSCGCTNPLSRRKDVGVGKKKKPTNGSLSTALSIVCTSAARLHTYTRVRSDLGQSDDIRNRQQMRCGAGSPVISCACREILLLIIRTRTAALLAHHLVHQTQAFRIDNGPSRKPLARSLGATYRPLMTSLSNPPRPTRHHA